MLKVTLKRETKINKVISGVEFKDGVAYLSDKEGKKAEHISKFYNVTIEKIDNEEVESQEENSELYGDDKDHKEPDTDSDADKTE